MFGRLLNIFFAPLLTFVGVEEEYLKRHAASLAAYKKGVQVKKSMSGTELKVRYCGTCT